MSKVACILLGSEKDCEEIKFDFAAYSPPKVVPKKIKKKVTIVDTKIEVKE